MRRASARPGNTRSLIASLSFRRARTVGRFKQLQPQSLPRWQCGLDSDLTARAARGDRVAAQLAAIAHSRLWHKTAVLCVPTNVCSWGKSGRAADITAKTDFDPKLT